jgi:hypothetical protein
MGSTVTGRSRRHRRLESATEPTGEPASVAHGERLTKQWREDRRHDRRRDRSIPGVRSVGSGSA